MNKKHLNCPFQNLGVAEKDDQQLNEIIKILDDNCDRKFSFEKFYNDIRVKLQL